MSCTGTEFELSEDDFRATEPPDMFYMPVFITKGVGTLANPVTFRVTPLTVIEAEVRGITNFTRPPNDANSPSTAGVHATLISIDNCLHVQQIRETSMQLLLR